MTGSRTPCSVSTFLLAAAALMAADPASIASAQGVDRICGATWRPSTTSLTCSNMTSAYQLADLNKAHGLKGLFIEVDDVVDGVAMKFIGEAATLSGSLTRLALLNQGKLTAEDYEHIEHLKALTELRLTNSNVPAEAFSSIARLPNLTVLDLSYTNVDGSGFDELAALTKLSEIRLGGAQNLTKENFLRLGQIRSLKQITVGGTGALTREDVEAIRQYLPNVRIGGLGDL